MTILDCLKNINYGYNNEENENIVYHALYSCKHAWFLKRISNNYYKKIPLGTHNH